MILMPIFGDQYSNAAAAQYRGVAIILEYNDFTEEKLRGAMDQIFNDTRYVSFLRLFLFLYHVCKREREREKGYKRSDREFRIPSVGYLKRKFFTRHVFVHRDRCANYVHRSRLLRR